MYLILDLFTLNITTQAELFENTVRKIEGDSITAIEVLKHLNILQAELKARKEDQFLSTLASEERRTLMQAGHHAHIDQICNEFYGKKLLLFLFIKLNI